MNAPSAPVRILVVEDSELDAELLLCELERDGLDVVSERVDNEPAFVAALARFAPDVVISDLSMPSFSGYRALEIAREKAPDVPFLFVSGTMGEEAAVEAVRGGATDYVLKHNLARLPASFRSALREAEERRARANGETRMRSIPSRFNRCALTRTASLPASVKWFSFCFSGSVLERFSALSCDSPCRITK